MWLAQTSGGGDAGVFLFLSIFVGLAIVIRLAAGGMDRDRIRTEVERRGGRVESIRWAPFGRGWFGEKGDRIYNVTYVDGRGRQRRASCKTSMFSGVYWHEEPDDDRPAPEPEDDEVGRLRAENERLRRELHERGGRP